MVVLEKQDPRLYISVYQKFLIFSTNPVSIDTPLPCIDTRSTNCMFAFLNIDTRVILDVDSSVYIDTHFLCIDTSWPKWLLTISISIPST